MNFNDGNVKLSRAGYAFLAGFHACHTARFAARALAAGRAVVLVRTGGAIARVVLLAPAGGP